MKTRLSELEINQMFRLKNSETVYKFLRSEQPMKSNGTWYKKCYWVKNMTTGIEECCYNTWVTLL